MPMRPVQVAENESRFRAVNERLQDAEDAEDAPGGENELLGFVCECGDADCTDRIELTRSEYARTRADGATFALVPGHEKSDFEEVVMRTDRFVLVRKFGIAGAVAEDRDPRA
jgi:hypothetical protein